VYAVRIRDLRHLRQRITDRCATVDPNMLSKIRTNMVKRLRKRVECRGEHIEHIMQIINKILIGSRLFGQSVYYIMEAAYDRTFVRVTRARW
jgi:hypothetical protein